MHTFIQTMRRSCSKLAFILPLKFPNNLQPFFALLHLLYPLIPLFLIHFPPIQIIPLSHPPLNLNPDPLESETPQYLITLQSVLASQLDSALAELLTCQCVFMGF